MTTKEFKQLIQYNHIHVDDQRSSEWKRKIKCNNVIKQYENY